MKIRSQAFHIISKTLYPLIGATMSTKLAYSSLGKYILSNLTGIKDFKDKKTLRIYTTDLGIRLQLEPYVAIGSGIIHMGVMNKPETEFLTLLLKPGDIVIDVGAYVDGWYTLLSGRIIGSTGHVYSFEPHPKYFKRLKDNISLNKLTNVTAEKLGISDMKGISYFYEADAGSSLYEDLAFRFNQKKSKKIRIKTITLDEYIKSKKLKKINLIKIDVEGAEMKLLKKAKNVLVRKDAPDLIVEVIDEFLKLAKSSEDEVIHYLKTYGYKPYVFSAKGLTKYKRGEKRTMMNMFFTKRKDVPFITK